MPGIEPKVDLLPKMFETARQMSIRQQNVSELLDAVILRVLAPQQLPNSGRYMQILSVKKKVIYFGHLTILRHISYF